MEALYVHAYDDLTAKVDELFREWDRNDSPGAALGIIRDGRIIYKRGYGMANLEHNIPIKPDSVFRIASISKQFFAAGIIILEQQGKISLDDDIRKYLPELHDYGHTVTIRHLIHHTGGIRDYLSLNYLAGRRIGKRKNDYFSMKDHMELMARQKGLNFKPGEKYLYSNSGYVLLAEIIARVSGSSEADFLKKYIFDPLTMKNTLVHTDCDQIVKNRAIGYSPMPDGGYKIDITRDQTTGHDAVFTSVEDMFLWDQNFYDNKLGIDKEKFIKALLTPGRLNNGDKITYALGLDIGEYRGLRTIRHDGAWAGYQAEYIQYPDQKFSIILFSNVSTFNPSNRARKIADIYLADKLAKKEEKKPAPEKKKLKEKQLLACEGTYWLETSKLLRRIVLEKKKLYYVRSKTNRTELAPITATEFIMLGTPQEVIVRFSDQEKGKYTKVTVIIAGEDSIPGKRIEPFEPTEADLKEYAGTYYSEELDAKYRIMVRDGKLYIKFRNFPKDPFNPLIRDAFSFSEGFIRLNFQRNEQGRISGFLVNTGRVVDLRFEKLEAGS